MNVDYPKKTNAIAGNGFIDGFCSEVDLSVDLGYAKFTSPLLTASGTFGYGIESIELLDTQGLGGVVTKGISPQPKKGNPAPRIWETDAGLINSIGLENPGMEVFLRDIYPRLAELNTRIVVNFFGRDEDDYVLCAERLGRGGGIDILEINLSCPNVKAGGLQFGTDPDTAGRIVNRCASVCAIPIWAKLCPSGHNLVDVGRACVQNGARGLTLGNTLPAMAIDPRTRRPRVGGVTGGLSGPAIRPVAVRAVYTVFKADLGVPIIGVGGITRAEDVCEFMLAGASLVQVGTQGLVEPAACLRLRNDLACFLSETGVSSVVDLVGKVQAT